MAKARILELFGRSSGGIIFSSANQYQVEPLPFVAISAAGLGSLAGPKRVVIMSRNFAPPICSVLMRTVVVFLHPFLS